MRRTLLLTPALAALALGAFLALRPSSSSAQPGQPGEAKAAPDLPVAQTILYSSGVGFFQREGTVDGSARVDLSFPATDINDLLKSMVLQDLSGGTVAAVSYDSQAPIEKTLQSFAVNLTGNPGFGDILSQARGEKVEVVTLAAATQPGTLTGSVVGVEKQKQQVGKDGIVEVEMLNLWCADGMRAVKLSEVQRVRFLNPTLDSEFKRALETLALSHDTQKKAVSLLFSGEGKRDVRVAYVVENPIWKTSYRLVLPSKKDAKPSLQGWAIVENATEDDWKDVRLTLVSGRPISFRMDLYQSLYVPRPLVEPELFASLRPPTYTGALERLADAQPKKPMADDFKDASRDKAPMEKKEAVRKLDELRRRAGADRAESKLEAESLDFGRGVQSAAAAGQLGDFFQYALKHAVNLPRQKSALLPIVQGDVEADRVSIYNQGVQAKHPLLGLRFKNTTGLHLMQGPITVFEGASYAGDARVLDLQPKEERLLSYAVDLGTEVEPVVEHAPQRLTNVKVNKGIVYQTNRFQESKKYTIKNRSEQTRTVLVEHPYRPGFRLTSKEQPAERARDVYRFAINAPTGETKTLEVAEEHDVVTAVSLSNADDQTMRFFLAAAVVSDAVKKALTMASDLKGTLQATRLEIQKLEKQLKDITDDQSRLRANLREMPPTAEAYKRYLKKFDDQETQIEDLQKRIKTLQETEHTQRSRLDEFLAKLDVE